MGNPDQIIEEVTTNESGQPRPSSFPPLTRDYSLEPEANQPYSQYTLTALAPGYDEQVVAGTQLLSGETAIQEIRMAPSRNNPSGRNIVIPAHTLYGDYPPKIPEDEIKPVNESGEIVLSRVVIPETVVVHDGPPSDSAANNYYVPYKEYNKKRGLQRDLCHLAGGH